jgi:hypothetical protein
MMNFRAFLCFLADNNNTLSHKVDTEADAILHVMTKCSNCMREYEGEITTWKTDVTGRIILK